MSKMHHYQIDLKWTGNLGKGTADYRSYERSHEIKVHKINANNQQVIKASSDPSFRGDKTKWNPEQMFLASIASCHQLWYLHLCSVNDVTVESYEDTPKGNMIESPNGSGQFTDIILYPIITVSQDSDIDKAAALHNEAHHLCFLANSVNFPIKCVPTITFKV